ncbi:MAG: hypothetical protein HY831_03825 [Candidatus Aenigmarchaeota archaeon]|nr:hypothetical protein [Candidatus Aenigmarchaeota archaeon]
MIDAEQENREHEFELVPISPVRKLERRVEELEHNTVTHRDLKDMFLIVKANQQSVDEIVKLNRSMMERIADLANASANIVSKMNDFLSRIEIEELPEAKEIRGITDYNERLTKMENRLNALILALNPRVKKPVAQRPMARPIARVA